MPNDNFIWASRPELHTSPDITWSICNNCPELTVKKREWAKHKLYEYYCNRKHKELDRKEIYEMKTEDCPLDRKPNGRRFR